MSVYYVILNNKVYFEDYSNILIFFLYLKTDRQLIEYMLSKATEIYREYEPCDLEGHVEFVNKLYTIAKKLILPAHDIKTNREEYRRRMDFVLEQGEEGLETRDNQKIVYSDELQDIVKINIALKTLRIMGQILRNFPGSLRGNLKHELAAASYELGLRTMRALLRIAEVNLGKL